MNAKIIGLALFITTAVIVTFYPAYQDVNAITTTGNASPVVIPVNPQQQPKIEVVFVLDTTGSMGGLLQAAKEKIWAIATTMASAQPAPQIKLGLVAYRDRGDAYITRVLDLSDDLDSMYAALIDFQAGGGGDGPESVNQALYDAVHKISWSQDQSTYKVVFLVGDAPPHMDYNDDVKYPTTMAVALTKGIVVNAIQCGQNQRTTQGWQRVAQLANGRYFQVEQAGNAVAIATPYDKQLALLSKKLDDTRIYYGSAEKRAQQQLKIKATNKLHTLTSFASRARRATFNASKTGETNLLGKGELVDAIANGRVDLSSIKKDQLPEPMQAMNVTEQKAMIKENSTQRNEILRQINQLSTQRAGFLHKKVDAAGGAKESLDEKIYSAVREQTKSRGLRYESESAAY